VVGNSFAVDFEGSVVVAFDLGNSFAVGFVGIPFVADLEGIVLGSSFVAVLGRNAAGVGS
jgi:hypothetical protein